MAERSKAQPSTGKLKEVAKGVDDGPNYLRAFSGSCHDFCKFGTPHEFREKPKRPVRRRSTPDSEVTVEIFVPSDKRSAKAVKPSSVAPDPAKSIDLEVAVCGKTPKPIRQQAPSKSLSNSGNQDFSFDMKPMLPDSSISAKQESPVIVKSLPPDSAKQESSSDVKSSSYPSLKKGSSSQRNSSNASKPTLKDVQSCTRSSLSNVSGSVRQSALKESKAVRSPRLMSGSISKASTAGIRSCFPNDRAPLKKQSTHPNLLLRKSGKRNTESKIESGSRTSEAALAKKTGSPSTTLSLNTRKSLKTTSENSLASSTTKVARLNVRKNKKVSRNTETTSASTNTLHFIESQQSKSPFSPRDAVETEESESDDHEGREIRPMKLKFSRGRKSLGNDQYKDDGVKVVLRHQDLQEKKSEKGLLNDVIEETASKLVETRKSKVKALVGAFETVISLQESKSGGEILSPFSSPARRNMGAKAL